MRLILPIAVALCAGCGPHTPALHRSEADLETNKTSGFYQGTEIAVDQLVEHVIAMKSVAAL